MLGADTFFLTGTDEHGQKIERAAQAAGKTPQEFADEVSEKFRALWKRMGISNDDFIRTTEERHVRRVQELWRVIRDNGYIYKGSYTGQYCVFDELYVDGGPESRVRNVVVLRRLFTKKIISLSSPLFKTSSYHFTTIRILFVQRHGGMKWRRLCALACGIFPSVEAHSHGAFLFPMIRNM